jgi:single-strand DNA-binding protein
MILTGVCRLGRDVEVRKTPNGDAVANLSLAYNYGKKDEEGNRPTTWIDASLWGERANKLAPYLKKGQQVCVVLEDVAIHVYDKSDGSKGHTLRARVSSLEFVGSVGDRQRTEPAKPAAPAKVAGGKFDDFEDDIPF